MPSRSKALQNRPKRGCLFGTPGLCIGMAMVWSSGTPQNPTRKPPASARITACTGPGAFVWGWHKASTVQDRRHKANGTRPQRCTRPEAQGQRHKASTVHKTGDTRPEWHKASTVLDRWHKAGDIYILGVVQTGGTRPIEVATSDCCADTRRKPSMVLWYHTGARAGDTRYGMAQCFNGTRPEAQGRVNICILRYRWHRPQRY